MGLPPSFGGIPTNDSSGGSNTGNFKPISNKVLAMCNRRKGAFPRVCCHRSPNIRTFVTNSKLDLPTVPLYMLSIQVDLRAA